MFGILHLFIQFHDCSYFLFTRNRFFITGISVSTFRENHFHSNQNRHISSFHNNRNLAVDLCVTQSFIVSNNERLNSLNT